MQMRWEFLPLDWGVSSQQQESFAAYPARMVVQIDNYTNSSYWHCACCMHLRTQINVCK